MTPLRADDLPKHVRDRLTADAITSAQGREVPTGARPKDLGPAYRCHSCPAEFDHWGAEAERHAAQPGHSRMDMVLTPTRST